MPYISKRERDFVDKTLEPLLQTLRKEPIDESLDGVLNYIVTRIVAATFEPLEGSKWPYHHIARAVAVFECAKLEFYRRVAAPKEDNVIKTNGDIPEYEIRPSVA